VHLEQLRQRLLPLLLLAACCSLSSQCQQGVQGVVDAAGLVAVGCGVAPLDAPGARAADVIIAVAAAVSPRCHVIT
jgi:hypothetical protein